MPDIIRFAKEYCKYDKKKIAILKRTPDWKFMPVQKKIKLYHRGWRYTGAEMDEAKDFINGKYKAALKIKQAEEKANQVCAACHGKDGVNGVLPSYPIIAGQYSDYLNQALIDYKSGARKNAVMGGIAATLTKEEMVGLARYFSSLPTPLNDKNRKD